MLHIHAIKIEDRPAFKLAGRLTIYEVGEARESLAKKQKTHPTLVLDLSDLEEIDTAGVQLLHWLKREAARNSREVSLVRHSPGVVEVLDLLRLAADFRDPILLPPQA